MAFDVPIPDFIRGGDGSCEWAPAKTTRILEGLEYLELTFELEKVSTTGHSIKYG